MAGDGCQVPVGACVMAARVATGAVYGPHADAKTHAVYPLSGGYGWVTICTGRTLRRRPGMGWYDMFNARQAVEEHPGGCESCRAALRSGRASWAEVLS